MRPAPWLAALALSACAAQPAIQPPSEAAARAATTDWSRAETITVDLDEYAFAPDQLTFRTGQPVRLRLVNTGARAHDFTSPGFFRTVALRQGDAAGAQALAAGGSVDVPAGATREVYLVALSPGTHEVDCVKPLHATLGMHGRITVLP